MLCKLEFEGEAGQLRLSQERLPFGSWWLWQDCRKVLQQQVRVVAAAGHFVAELLSELCDSTSKGPCGRTLFSSLALNTLPINATRYAYKTYLTIVEIIPAQERVRS